MAHMKHDERYTLNLEYCGYEKPRYVMRFCGEWLGQAETKNDAAMFYIAHSDERERAMKGLDA